MYRGGQPLDLDMDPAIFVGIVRAYLADNDLVLNVAKDKDDDAPKRELHSRSQMSIKTPMGLDEDFAKSIAQSKLNDRAYDPNAPSGPEALWALYDRTR
jgi:hypothetical protein